MALSLGAAAILGGSSILSGLGSAALTSGSAYRQFKYQSQLQEQAARLNYEYGQKNALNSPTWNRQGLEKAGYNPMLAVQNSTSGANAGWTTTGQAGSFDESAGLASGVSNAMSLANMRNQTAQTDSQIKLNEATGRNQIADAINKEIESGYIDEKNQSLIKNTIAQTTKLESDTAYNEAVIQNMQKKLELEQYLGEMGLAVQRRGQDKLYNASTYASDVNERNNIRSNRTTRGRISGPLGFSGYIGQFNDFYQRYYDMLPHH